VAQGWGCQLQVQSAGHFGNGPSACHLIPSARPCLSQLQMTAIISGLAPAVIHAVLRAAERGQSLKTLNRI